VRPEHKRRNVRPSTPAAILPRPTVTTPASNVWWCGDQGDDSLTATRQRPAHLQKTVRGHKARRHTGG